jgi:hypothetical protein
MLSTKYPYLKMRGWVMTASFSAITLILAGLPSCSNGSSSATNKTLDSLKLANARLDSTRKAAYKNHDISIIFLEANLQILQCRLLLDKADAGGQKVGVADSLLVNSKKGDTLYQSLTKLYDLGTLYAKNETDKTRFAAMKTPANNKQWLEKNFKGVSTVEAGNTLSRFLNDCSLINQLVPR